MTPHFGFAWDAADWIMPLGLARRLRNEFGADHIRYLIQWPQMEPERGRFDWSFIDPTVAAIRDAGIEILIPNLYFYPSWVTGGDFMTSYDCRCCKGARSLTEEEAPECYSLVSIDSPAIRFSHRVLATHLGDKAIYYAILNEPGVRQYWLTTRDDTPQTSMDRWYSSSALPAIQGIQDVRSDAILVSQYDGYCDYARPPKMTLVGGHPYANVAAAADSRWVQTDNEGSFDVDATTDSIVKKVKEEFIPRLGRVDWITEIQHCDVVRLMKETGLPVTEHNPARYVDLTYEFYDSRHTRPKSISGTWELTDEGRILAKVMQGGKVPHRRRGVPS